MIALALITIALNCTLANDIDNSARTRSTLLRGEIEQTTSKAEKAVLGVEIEALKTLQHKVIIWQAINNCEGEKQ